MQLPKKLKAQEQEIAEGCDIYGYYRKVSEKSCYACKGGNKIKVVEHTFKLSIGCKNPMYFRIVPKIFKNPRRNDQQAPLRDRVRSYPYGT